MKTKLIALFFAFAASIGTLFAQSGTCGPNLNWTLDNGILTITGSGAMKNYSSSSSAPWYSYSSDIQSISLPEGLTTIGSHAFSYCYSIESISIPNSVTSIEEYAFYSCTSLNSITLPNSLISIGYRAFGSCEKLTSIAIPNSVTSIGDYTFYDCKDLLSITLPNGITSIGNSVFFGCQRLSSISLPNSVTSIGPHAFANCSRLTSITIPNGVTSIEWGTFDGSGLTSITIPNSVTHIGKRAFRNCSSLISVTIPNSVTSIGYRAFAECHKLTSVTIPGSVTSLDEGAFNSCLGLTSVTCYALTPPTLGFDVFTGVLTSKLYLYVPSDAIDTYKDIPEWVDSFADILPIGATRVEAEGVQINPMEDRVQIIWEAIVNAVSYELSLQNSTTNVFWNFVFDSVGKIINWFFSAPARRANRVPAEVAGTGFSFTITDLEPGTTYNYTIEAKNASGEVIDTKNGSFSTISSTVLEDIMDNSTSTSSVHKVIQDGQLFILREGKIFNAQGARVR